MIEMFAANDKNTHRPKKMSPEFKFFGLSKKSERLSDNSEATEIKAF